MNMIFPANCFEYFGWRHSPGFPGWKTPQDILVLTISVSSPGYSPGKTAVARPACTWFFQPDAGGRVLTVSQRR